MTSHVCTPSSAFVLTVAVKERDRNRCLIYNFHDAMSLLSLLQTMMCVSDNGDFNLIYELRGMDT